MKSFTVVALAALCVLATAAAQTTNGTTTYNLTLTGASCARLASSVRAAAVAHRNPVFADFSDTSYGVCVRALSRSLHVSCPRRMQLPA